MPVFKQTSKNLTDPAVIEYGPDWVRFKSRGPETLDTILPVGSCLLTGLAAEDDGIWLAYWEELN